MDELSIAMLVVVLIAFVVFIVASIRVEPPRQGAGMNSEIGTAERKETQCN